MKREMSDNETMVAGRRRSRGSTVGGARVEALNRLKALRQGGSRRSEIKIESPIYDTIDEDEYKNLVDQRRDDFKSFIVDDDGLGYGDEGEEEDWTKAGAPPSSGDESDGQLERTKRKKSEKKEPAPKKPSALSAAAALMGKQRISSMFTSSIFKKGKDDKAAKILSSDSIVDNVIAEFAPDEADRERRRRGNAVLWTGSVKFTPMNSITPIKSENLPIVKREIVVTSTTSSETVGEKKLSKDLRTEVVDEPVGFVIDEPVGFVIDEPIGFVIDDSKDVCEVKVEPVVKKEEVYALNAKVQEETNPVFSANAGWEVMGHGGKGSNGAVAAEGSPGLNSEEKSDIEVDSSGLLPFYMLDAHEEFYGSNVGHVYLFGKVKAGSSYHSCCVVVKNMQRCLYAIPNGSVFDDAWILEHEQDAKDSKTSPAFHAKLHEMALGLKTDVAKHLIDINVTNFTTKPVKRNYAFERSDISRGENYVLKINYPFKDPPLPPDLKGETFSALLGTHSSALELFLIKRKIKGPAWLSISKFSSCPSPQRVSWCKFEVVVDCPKNIQVTNNTLVIPPVVVTAVNLKTIINEKHNVNEIASASVICCHKAKIDTPMLASEWTSPGLLSHFTVVRKLEGGIFPMGFTKDAADRNSKAGSNIISSESSERALLNRLMIELHKLDSDILVGHNISGFDLDVLLHRAQACRVPSSMWSKIGRLKRSAMPRLTKGCTVFGSGASPGIMSCIAGLLLCDTFLCSRDLLKEVSYSLTQLAKTQLNKLRKEISPHDIPRLFQNSDTLMELIEYGETDAWLSMELMFHLSILPLTRQLTNISGNLWGKTLQGARAQRVEYLLLHAFHAKKFMVPDKSYSHPKETKSTKRKLNGLKDKGSDETVADDATFENEPPPDVQEKTKKGPAYAGGLVLEPKRGLYDKYILLLDFNSLYPSIIQEYNICFTTVERTQDGSAPVLPSAKAPGLLPELLRNLVERRKCVKRLLKTASGLKLQQYDIQQQALKLTANSMYGCLGFSNSRFYAKPLAELITLQGREILQSTVDLVQNSLNLEVIYGDTDSIMIYSGLDDIAEAKKIAAKVIQEVNKRYKRLEIDLDGVYKRMLLLKKKKYAAIKEQFRDGKVYKVIERKGLDMVRRDWSLLSKETGDFCLDQILSEKSCEDVVESIHKELRKVQEDMRNGQIALEKYIITKSLTKPPEAYPDAKSQPHVEVALRLKKMGYITGCSSGDTVPYIICCEQGDSSSTSAGIAQRARHPDELKKDNGKWIVDIDYYLAQQIHPVVSRLCASIEGTSPARLADCLGLDPSKFQSKSIEVANNDHPGSLLFPADNEERYRGCEPLVLSCPSCSFTFDCPSIFSYICSISSEDAKELQPTVSSNKFWHRMHCPKCPEEDDRGRISPASIANQVKRQAEGFISTYYKSLMTCDDETCKYTTRSLNLRVMGDSERGTICPNYPRCNGRLVRKYSEAELYKQLTFFCHALDTSRCIDKVESKIRMPIEKELARIRPLVDLAASTVQKIRDRCAYGWVQLNDLAVTV